MISKQELEAQLAAIPRFQATSVKKELARLHEKMQPGERIVAALSGLLDGSNWLGVATDRRVLFLLIKLLGGESTWEASYESLTVVECKTGLFLSQLVLGAPGAIKKISAHKADCRNFADAVMRMRAHRTGPSPGVAFEAVPLLTATPSSVPPASPSKLGIIVSVVCVVGVCNAIFGNKDEAKPSSSSSGLPDPSASTVQAPSGARPAETIAPALLAPCERARPSLERHCPRIDISGRCQVATHSQTTLEIDKLGPGELIGVGGPGPEWFIKSDGTLITVNGLAGGACDGLQDVPGYLGEKVAASAPRRGDSAKTYEGTYNKAGEYTHQDCSEFEIRVARVFYRELMRDESVDENVALRRAAKKVDLKPKTLNEIYQKVSAQCLLAMTSG
jgi:hypothetical protein